MGTQIWLITGSSRDLGRAFTEAALNAGHRVFATARNSDDLIDIASKYGESVRTVSLDVRDEAQAKYAADTATEAFGSLEVLVNNAGYGNVSSVEDTSLDEFRCSNRDESIRRHHYDQSRASLFPWARVRAHYPNIAYRRTHRPGWAGGTQPRSVVQWRIGKRCDVQKRLPHVPDRPRGLLAAPPRSPKNE
jgi:hypothetical protein